MEYIFNTQLKGNISFTDDFNNSKLLKDNSLYKFIWVKSGKLQIEIDHIDLEFEQNDLIPITPLHHIAIKNVEGEYVALLFNSNFYCIYGHDNEVSCNGFLFNGTSNVMNFKLTKEQTDVLEDISLKLIQEFKENDSLQEEMLRILLKRFIITSTRIARKIFNIGPDDEKSFDLIRQFYVLVDNYFREKKQVKDYADMLHRSPKTLSNLFAQYQKPSPLKIIHERIESEAKRLLLYTSKNAKEIADIIGFDDLSSFSRFFKKVTGESISDYRKREKRKN